MSIPIFPLVHKKLLLHRSDNSLSNQWIELIALLKCMWSYKSNSPTGTILININAW